MLHTDDVQQYGVSVPDLAGCFSAGNIIEDALESVKGAIELHLEGLMEKGQNMPMRLLTNYNVKKSCIYIITVPSDRCHEAIGRVHANKSP